MVLLAATNVQPLIPACAINFNLGIEQKAGVSLRFRRIFLEVYPRRLRLQHDSEYPAEFSNSIPEGRDRRSHDARDACRRAWVQRICRLRSHTLPLVQPRSRRNQFRRGLCPGGAAPTTISPFSRLRTSIISSRRGGCEVYGRDSPGDSTPGCGRERAGLCHCSDSQWGRSADDRIVLRRHVRHHQPAASSVQFTPLSRDTDPHCRAGHLQRGYQSVSNCAARLLDVALGSQVCGRKITIVNLSDRVALYNFLSSFSGTRFIRPAPLKQS
jgi:hypothetical protein